MILTLSMFMHVFGCPVQYEPHGGALHKRGRKTEWGYFVGVQWPMVLILRPEDGKVMSVLRKKVLCHEEIYATFDATNEGENTGRRHRGVQTQPGQS